MRVLNPPANRLVVLDPRLATAEAVRIALTHRTNLLLADLVSCALLRRAPVRVSRANAGKVWARVMANEGVDFEAIDV